MKNDNLATYFRSNALKRIIGCQIGTTEHYTMVWLVLAGKIEDESDLPSPYFVFRFQVNQHNLNLIDSV